MATTTITFPSDQHNNWATGISIPGGYYISSISISCGAVYNESASIPVTLYIGGVQLAICQPGSQAGFGGSATGNITGTTITANYNYFSFRAEVTITYTLTESSSTTARTITRAVSPGGSGSITTKKNGSSVNKAYKNDTIAVEATPGSGYAFDKWTTSPANLISSTEATGSFRMPDQNVTVTGNFLKISTGTLSKTSINGGDTVVLTINAQNSSLSHKYKLSFGNGMETEKVSVGAGVVNKNITVPLSWSEQIPNATSKTGGTLLLETYSGSKLIGSTTITGLTYKVPATVIPTIGTVTRTIVRTIDGTTYASLGNIYVQNHSGVRVQTSAAGARGSTIVGLTVKIGSYAGNKYNKTVATDSIDFTSGLLGTSGTNKIVVTAVDSRGRTATKTVTIDVTAYGAPSGSLEVWRTDSGGNRDDMGTYGKYKLSKKYSNVGNNTLTTTLEARGDSANNPANSGTLLPGSTKNFPQTGEYTIRLTLADKLETTVITAKINSARFIMACDASGNRLGIMKFPNRTIPEDKARTFEISDDTQMFYGTTKLETYLAGTVIRFDSMNTIQQITDTDATYYLDSGIKFSDYDLILFMGYRDGWLVGSILSAVAQFASVSYSGARFSGIAAGAIEEYVVQYVSDTTYKARYIHSSGGTYTFRIKMYGIRLRN